ncbi:uncharacterized protein LOC135846500 [Planococcus citri]|uniref:uncharacterized protein LOC135846500 n=1 Tax=Planococcus citri TaxID=170843 RepID=UPI0031F80678
MPTVTEMLCMFCLRSVTTTSPVCEENNTNTIKESIVISSCRHLMHMSCFVDLIPSDPVSCRHPECGKVLDRDEVLVIDAILKDRRIIVESTDEKCNFVEELSERLIVNVATCNLVEELTTFLKAAKDKIAELEANIKNYSELGAKVDKRSSQAETAELNAKNLYELALEKLTDHLVACKCTSRPDFGVPVLSTSIELLSTLKQSKPRSVMDSQTPEIAPVSRSNDVFDRNQEEIVRVEKIDQSNVATSPNKEPERPMIESIADFPNVLADFVPTIDPSSDNKFVPFPESIEEPKETTDTSMKSPSSLHHHAKDLRQQSSDKKCIVTEEPISECRQCTTSNHNANHSLRNTSGSSESLGSIAADEAGSSRRSRRSRSSSSGYRRKMKAQKTAITAQKDRSPEAKRWKGPSESSTHDYERYWQRFRITPPKLNPFSPLNSFPMGYTVAGIQDPTEKVCKVAILAYDVLLLGDGHALSVANYILKNKPFKDQLSESLYRRNLSIIDLVMNLNFYFTVLPERIILCIGNWDASQNMPSEQFLAHFKDLLQIFKKCQVKVLYTLPIITHPGMDADANRDLIAQCLSTDWSKTLGGQYVLFSEMVSNAIGDQIPVVEDKGPMYALDQYAPLVEAIRDRFIPVAMALPDVNEAEAEAPWNTLNGHQT